MLNPTVMHHPGQGSLEYLLLLGGATLVGMIVILLVFLTFPAAENILGNNLGGYSDLGLTAGLGDTPPPPPTDLVGDISFANEEVGITITDSPTPGVSEIIYNPGPDESIFALNAASPMWEAHFTDNPSHASVSINSTLACANPVTYSQWVSGNKELLELYWTDCPVNGELDQLVDVTLHAELPEDSPRVLWSMSIKNNTTHYGVDRATLRWNISRKSSGDRLLIPTLSGAVITDPAANIKTFNHVWWSTFTQMQAYYNVDPGDGAGILLYSMDPLHNRAKHRGWRASGGDTTALFMSEYGENPFIVSDFSFPYTHAMEVYSGDWYDATQRYRAWVETTPIVSRGKLSTRTDVPAWYKEMGFHLIQNYPAPTYDVTRTGAEVTEQDPVDFFKKVKDYYLPCDEYQSAPCSVGQSSQEKMGLFQWDWYQNEYDSGTGTWSYNPSAVEDKAYGEYVTHPVIGGPTGFANTVSPYGINFMGYTLSFGHSVNGPNYTSGKTLINQTCLGPTLAPQLITEGSSGSTNNVAVMRHDSSVWQQHYAEFVKQSMVDQGFKGVYLDNPYFVAEGCYNPSNNTPQGEGGTYIFEGFRNLMSTIQSAANDPNFILFYENGSETFLPVADAFSNYGQNDLPLGWVELDAQTSVPLMETLYHDYTLFTAGNTFPSIIYENYFAYQGKVSEFPEAMRASLSAGFVRGKIPLSAESLLNLSIDIDPAAGENLVYDLALHEYSDGVSDLFSYTEFLKTAIKVRKSEAKKYLIYGQLVRPLSASQFSPASKTFTFQTTNTIDVPATPFDVSFPEVMHSVWKASDEKIGILFVNYTKDLQSVSLVMGASDFQSYGLPAFPIVKQLQIGGVNAPVSTVVFNTIPSLPSSINLPSGGMVFYELS